MVLHTVADEVMFAAFRFIDSPALKCDVGLLIDAHDGPDWHE